MNSLDGVRQSARPLSAVKSIPSQEPSSLTCLASEISEETGFPGLPSLADSGPAGPGEAVMTVREILLRAGISVWLISGFSGAVNAQSLPGYPVSPPLPTTEPISPGSRILAVADEPKAEAANPVVAGGMPTHTLTGPASILVLGRAFPPGTVTSPWSGEVPAGYGCCGPTGAHGPLTYELYFLTGPSLPVAGGQFIGALKTGWVVGGGGRSLFFNPQGDRAWVLDLGLTYTRNDGRSNRVYDIFTPGPSDPQTGDPTIPDELNPFYVRDLSRTSFNFALGRDWFLRGPGFLGAAQPGNIRVGAELGGRWGTGHVILIPIADQTTHLRKHDVFHGVFLGAHADYEIPLGATLFFAGIRTQWGYTWADFIPPQDSDIQDVNFLLTFGLRF